MYMYSGSAIDAVLISVDGVDGVDGWRRRVRDAL